MNRLLYLIGYSQKVAFTAGIHGPGSTGKGRTLVFPVVLNNEGVDITLARGYLSPQKTDNMCSLRTPKDSTVTLSTWVLFTTEDLRLCQRGGWKKDFYDSGSNLVALNLKKGDKVWAQCHSGSTYYSEGIAITTFSGFLV